MRVKIVSDGTSPIGTRVVNAETGEELERVVSVEWRHEAGYQPNAVITDISVEAELEAEATIETETITIHKV
jgi:hypothetical protein